MRKLAAVPLALFCSAAQQPAWVGVDQLPPGSKCTQSVELDTFIGEAASAELATRMMSAARAPKLRWIPAGTAAPPKHDPKLLTVVLDAQNRVVSAKCN